MLTLSALMMDYDYSRTEEIKDALACMNCDWSDGGETTDYFHKAVTHFKFSRERTGSFLQMGAKPNAKDKMGNTPLHVVYDSQTASLLLQFGADPTLLNNNGNTVLHTAKHPDLIPLFMHCQLNVNAKNNNGLTPLISQMVDENHKCCVKSYINYDIVKALVLSDADLTATDPYGNSALHLTFTPNHFISSEMVNDSLLSLLIEKMDNIDIPNNFGETPLLRCLKSCYDQVYTQSYHYDNPLYPEQAKPKYNMKQAVYQWAKALIERGADVQAKDDDGATPLHYAMRYMIPELTQLLLSHGADPLAKDKKGKTPADYLEESKIHRYQNEKVPFKNLGLASLFQSDYYHLFDSKTDKGYLMTRNMLSTAVTQREMKIKELNKSSDKTQPSITKIASKKMPQQESNQGRDITQ